MVQLNKDERVWVCFEMRECRMHMQYKECGLTIGLAEEFLPSMEYSRITENTSSMALPYIEISKPREISLVSSCIVIKGEIKDKKLWFQSTTSFRLLQLITQSIFV